MGPVPTLRSNEAPCYYLRLPDPLPFKKCQLHLSLATQTTPLRNPSWKKGLRFFSFCSLGHIQPARRTMQVSMGEDEVGEEVEVKNSINVWRQSERKVMIEAVQDLIQTSHKYAKSQYTPNAQRVRWTKLAGQLIWYKDQILKNFSLEAMTVQLEALQKRMIESDEQRERETRTRDYQTIVFRKPEERKAEDADKAQDGESAEADDPEGAKEVA